MKKQEVIDLIKSKGLDQDRFGHFKFTKNNLEYRIKIQKKSLHLEVKFIFTSNYNEKVIEWRKLNTEYFYKLTPDHKIFTWIN